jgi:hypothetical protein
MCSLDPVRSSVNPVLTFTFCFCKVHLNVFLRSRRVFQMALSWGFPTTVQFRMHLYSLYAACHIHIILLGWSVLILDEEYKLWSYLCNFLCSLVALSCVQVLCFALFLKHCQSVLSRRCKGLSFTHIWSYCQWKRVAEEHMLLQDLFQVLLFELCPELKAEWWRTFQNERLYVCMCVCVCVCVHMYIHLYVQICMMDIVRCIYLKDELLLGI